MKNEKTEKSFSALSRLMRYTLKIHAFSFFAAIAFIILGAAAGMRGMLFTQSLVDDYIIPLLRQDVQDYSMLASAIINVCGWYGLGLISSYLYNIIMVSIAQNTMLSLRKDVFNNMESLPVKYFDTHAHGDIMSVYTNDIDTLRQLLGQSVPMGLNSLATLTASLISIFILSLPLAVITVSMSVIMLIITATVAGKSGNYFMAQQKDVGEVNGYIEEMIDGQRVVKVFNHEEKAVSDFIEINDSLFESSRKANFYSNVIMPVNGNIGNLSYVLCAIIGAIIAVSGNGAMTVGTVIAFLGLNKNFTNTISQASQQLSSVVMAAAGAERTFKLMDEKIEENEGYVELVNVEENADGSYTESQERTRIWAWKHFHKGTGETEYIRQRGEIVMDKVNFGYNDDNMVLHDISLLAKPGQKIALVGSTGAGKTTITNLINRFYDIRDGKIRYDGININKIKKQDLRRSLGTVLQETNLFTGTVIDNIRYGRLDASDEECIEAAKLANAHSFIKRLPEGYNTVLKGNASRLSQGQRQLLSIARTAVADPPALILDEATSSIDTRTEKLVQNGMDALMNGRTTFVIAHRLSTIKNADCIMVMERGRIIERGTHDELIAAKGRYYELYTGAKAGA